ncbi:endonuclease domain-containing protein [Hymenobacter roseosalivarius]|uniref:endonuclease domain-containing protein n=1 Tax=Hymenobacter roseosalivarius TaxID=89967 RepID=UPI001F30C0C3|nr:endonuclease domain-containing protein [Hymenobacter roseosalivarius]
MPDAGEAHESIGSRPRLTANKTKWHERLKPFSGQMRREPTPAEEALWQALRNRKLDNVKFRRQHAIGSFIVDFFSSQHNLVIEVDGDVHAEEAQAQYDEGRTYELEGVGYHLLRFTNYQVLNELPLVLRSISETLHNQSISKI